MKKLLTTTALSLALISAGCGKKGDTPATQKPYVRISSNEKVVATASSSFNLYVTSNTNWTVEAMGQWLHTDKTAGNGNMTVKVSCEASDVERRAGVVRLKAAGINPVDLIVTQTDRTFTNPIFNMPDPWVVKREDSYYICKAQGAGVNLARSGKLSQFGGTSSVWKCPTDAGAVKPWNVANVWAPELHYIDGTWYIYYTAGRPHAETNSYGTQRSGVLRAKTDNPQGAYDDMGMLYTGNEWQSGIVATAANTIYAIDLTVFKLNGQLYAVWSGQPTATDGSQRLYIATMSNPYTISSSRVEISKADQVWEKYSGSINEGPAILINEAKGKLFVVYSCNGSWTKQYRLGYLMLDMTKDPMVASNWTKSSNYVFWRCDDTSDRDGVNGVGHCSFTKSPDETEDWIFYHVKHRNDNTWESGRSAFIQKFTWKADGTPDFGTPVGWNEPVVIPSGE
ncbi:MAG: family 43 glycosylhydrolase [Rikenellaceae bacterium]|jgi:GH43 family beta-xylosidase|nr:family 43 glycosylhydrolase [Rikenellaceae bacterium]